MKGADMNLWQRIAKFFTEWDGEDMTKTMPLSVDDLRLVNSQRIMLTTLERERKENRARAIEEFAERLKEEYKPCKETDTEIYENVCNRIDKIADQLKGGAV